MTDISAVNTSSGFNKTLAKILATENSSNITYVHAIYKGHEEYSIRSQYGGEIPSKVFNAFAVIFFGTCALWQLALFAKFRNKFYSIAMHLYLVGETIGYVGRFLSTNDIEGYSLENTKFYIIQFTLLTICPNFFNAAVYSQYGRFLYVYGTSKEKINEFNVFGKKLQPTLMSFILIFIDFLCIFIQGAGGNILRDADSKTQFDIGNGVYIGGIALQCFSMTCFTFLFTKLMYNIHVKQRLVFIRERDVFHIYGEDLRSYSPVGTFFLPWKWPRVIRSISLQELAQYTSNDQPTTIPIEVLSNTQAKMFKIYPIVLLIAFAFAILRCFYRLFEVAIGGWGGYLMTHEAFLIALDFVPMSIGAVITAIFSEGIVFGKIGLKVAKRIKLEHYDNRSPRKRLAYDLKQMFSSYDDTIVTPVIKPTDEKVSFKISRDHF
ncbi:hypothetical protein ACO0SA_001597 [Hanseniaspora valbyensis]